MTTIGERLKEIRGDESQEDFSATFGIHRNTLARWEKNQRPPDFEFIQKIAYLKGISPEWLLFGNGPIRNDGIEELSLSEENQIDSIQTLLSRDNALLTVENRNLRQELQRLKMEEGGRTQVVKQEIEVLPDSEAEYLRRENRELTQENRKLWQENQRLNNELLASTKEIGDLRVKLAQLQPRAAPTEESPAEDARKSA